MTQEKKQEFTRRLSCCNRGEMIVIIYDILFSHLEDALAAQEKGKGLPQRLPQVVSLIFSCYNNKVSEKNVLMWGGRDVYFIRMFGLFCKEKGTEYC